MHLAPVAGDLVGNTQRVQRAMGAAAARGAALAITPELALSGYGFPWVEQGAWIERQPDCWLRAVATTAQQLGLAVLIGAAERDVVTRELHNSAFLIDHTGTVIAHHRKINVAADGWSRPGTLVGPMIWRALRIGCLICADAYTPDVAGQLRDEGADILVSPANWGPGPHGPAGEWEARSRETGLPFFVCNRTGRDGTMDFSQAESLVIIGGERRLAHHSLQPTLLTFDWNAEERTLQSREWVRDPL
ncbi:MAG: carbon-nitrogen hydrolase family protein [Rhodospirillales bacterium]